MKLNSSNSYVARQAIVSASQEIVGYELLFRDGSRNVMPQVSADEAASRLLVESQLELGFENLVGIHKAFINFSERSLLENFPLVFDKSKIIVDIMASVKPTARVMRACSLLRTKGYKLSLDDGLLRGQWSEHGELIEIVKIDIGSLGTPQLKSTLSHLKKKRKTILARGVDTHEQFAQGREMGIDYFQGDFLSKPEIVEKQKFSSSKVNMLELMAEASKQPMNFESIRTIIFRDILLSFKLLKFLDSAAFGLSNAGRIKSLGHALTYLGETEFRKFISLVAMASIGEDKPSALVSLAAVRARFCEFLAHELGAKAGADSAFLCGLMSLIDAVMNESIESIFLKLPIDRAIKDAIKGNDSEIGTILKLAVAYENGEWRQVEEHARRLNIEESTLGSNYRNAIYWARSFENAFGDSGAPQK